MNHVTLILKNGREISDQMSNENYQAMVAAFGRNHGLAAGPSNLQFDGLTKHGTFVKSEVAGIISE